MFLLSLEQNYKSKGYIFGFVFLQKLAPTHTVGPATLVFSLPKPPFSQTQDICTCCFLSLDFWFLFYLVISCRSQLKESFSGKLSLLYQHLSVPLVMLQRTIPLSCSALNSQCNYTFIRRICCLRVSNPKQTVNTIAETIMYLCVHTVFLMPSTVLAHGEQSINIC